MDFLVCAISIQQEKQLPADMRRKTSDRSGD
jgi:hypothetical protein